jgi:hypothetical protein
MPRGAAVAGGGILCAGMAVEIAFHAMIQPGFVHAISPGGKHWSGLQAILK